MKASAVVGDACLIVGTVIAVAADGVSFTMTACDEVAACVAARLGAMKASAVVGDACLIVGTVIAVAADGVSFTTTACDKVAACVAA